ncbi:MAG: sigma-70 family RNA polymerase sigma factor [Deltaproteobacteria bacterium]|nr:MAG: sigma-70 family RNA polymerase sigma factor [Deltaproteobacteria bacterium]
MSRLTDEEARYIAALRRRDERAFNALVVRYQDRVYNLVLRLLGNPEEARDVAQEVFVTVFEKIDKFRGDSKLGTWIYRVATNHAKNRIKYLSRRKDRQQDSFEEMPVQPTDGRLSASFPRPDEAMEGQRLGDLIGRALEALDPDQREVVVLRDIDGQSYEAIAAITGQNVGTVKSRLHRGRLRLKDVLEHWMKGRDVLADGSRRG